MKHKDERSQGSHQRILRVGELVRHELAALLARGEIEDPELAGVVITVAEVRMSPDLKLASAYVMPLGGARSAEVAEALNRHRKFVRGQIAPGLNLKFAPEVRFFVDTTFEEFGRIDALLRSERVRQDIEKPADDSNGD